MLKETKHLALKEITQHETKITVSGASNLAI